MKHGPELGRDIAHKFRNQPVENDSEQSLVKFPGNCAAPSRSCMIPEAPRARASAGEQSVISYMLLLPVLVQHRFKPVLDANAHRSLRREECRRQKCGEEIIASVLIGDEVITRVRSSASERSQSAMAAAASIPAGTNVCMSGGNSSVTFLPP